MAVDRRTHSLDGVTRSAWCAAASRPVWTGRRHVGRGYRMHGSAEFTARSRSARHGRGHAAPRRDHHRRSAASPDKPRSPGRHRGLTASRHRVAAMTWLITGGAGYIGAHVARAMTAAGERVVVLDDLSVGRRRAAARRTSRWCAARSLDRELLDRTLAEHAVTGVVHLAAKKQVGESVEQPLRYYRENVHGLTVLLEAVVAAGVAPLPLLLLGRRLRHARTWTSSPRTPRARRSTRTARPSSPASGWCGRPGRAHGIVHGLSALLQRGGRRASRSWPTPACSTSSRCSSTGSPAARPRGSSATTIRPRTAPASGTTSMSRTWPTPISRRPAGSPSRTAPGDLTVNIGRGEGVSVRELADLVGEVTGTRRAGRVVEPRRPGRRRRGPSPRPS